MFLHLKEREDSTELPAWKTLKPECSPSFSSQLLSSFSPAVSKRLELLWILDTADPFP